MPTVREATFELLRELGMTTVFGNPGSTELTFLKDFPDDFSYVLGLQEGVVLGMAEGFAQGTGRAALVNLHTAPGLGNAMGVMVTAYHNKTPLVVTAGQQDRRHAALEPLLTGRLVDLAKPYVKRSYEPLRAQDVPHEVQRAFHTAMQPPTGPVFVSVPMDDWDADAGGAAAPSGAREVVYRTAPDPEGLARVAEALDGSRSPAIVAGGGVDRARAFPQVVALAERLRAAVYADPISPLSGFPQDHPLFQGHLPPAQAELSERLSPHDVVVVLGAPVFLYYPRVPGPVIAEGTRLFQVTDDPAEAARAATGTSLIGDVGLAASALAELLPEATREAPSPWERPPVPEANTPIPVDYLMHVLADLVPDDVALVDETASSKAKLHGHIRPSAHGGYHSSATGGLGYVMPAAVGLKLAMPERSVVCVIGDGSAMYSLQALWTAARYGVALPFVVVNNSGYSILKGYRDSIGAGGKVPGLDVPDIDFVSLARGMGVDGERVEDGDELRGALERAMNAGSPYLLDVIVDPEVPKLLK